MERLKRHPSLSLRSFALWLVVANVLVDLALGVGLWNGLRRSQHSAEHVAGLSVGNLVGSLAADIASDLRVVERALELVAKKGREMPGATLARIDAAAYDARQVLGDQAQLRVADVNGQEGAAAHTSELFMSNRTFFLQVLRTDEVQLSAPWNGPGLADRSIVLARRLLDDDGRPLGVAYAIVPADQLQKKFQSPDLGQAGAISLRSTDLRLVARYSVQDPAPSPGFGGTDVSDKLRTIVDEHSTQGTYITLSALDQIERLNGYRQVPGYPLMLIAGMGTESYLAPWRAEALRQASRAFLVALTLAALSAYLYTKHRQERRARLDAAQLATEQHLLLQNELVGMMRLEQRHATWVNEALERMFGYEPGELKGTSSRVLYLDDESFEDVGRGGYLALAAGHRYRTQLRMRRKDGTPIWVDLSGASVAGNTSLWMAVDIEALKRSEEAAHQQAGLDPLTGLPNRRRLEAWMGEDEGPAEMAPPMGFAYIDLDGFKQVNDTLGHAAGDEVLKAVGARLAGCLRDGDVAARMGGDEFAVVLTSPRTAQEAMTVLTRCLDAIAAPISLRGGPSVSVGASIGLALRESADQPTVELTRRADMALYEAKSAGKGRVCLWSKPAAPEPAAELGQLV